MTKSLGDLLFKFALDKPKSGKQCLALAQRVYMECDQHVEAMLCMVKQGRVNQALEYGKKVRMSYKTGPGVWKEGKNVKQNRSRSTEIFFLYKHCPRVSKEG